MTKKSGTLVCMCKYASDAECANCKKGEQISPDETYCCPTWEKYKSNPSITNDPKTKR